MHERMKHRMARSPAPLGPSEKASYQAPLGQICELNAVTYELDMNTQLREDHHESTNASQPPLRDN